jgi:hypothetical protein
MYFRRRKPQTRAIPLPVVNQTDPQEVLTSLVERSLSLVSEVHEIESQLREFLAAHMANSASSPKHADPYPRPNTPARTRLRRH